MQLIPRQDTREGIFIGYGCPVTFKETSQEPCNMYLNKFSFFVGLVFTLPQILLVLLVQSVQAQFTIEQRLCRHNGRYVVFAQKPLQGSLGVSQPRPQGGFTDRNNIQLAHEHIFFCNNGRVERNVGFGKEGRFSEKTLSDQYALIDDKRYDSNIISSILGPDQCYISEANTYGELSNNCQDFAARVRQEYWRRIKAPDDCQKAVSNSIRRIENARTTVVKFEQFKQRSQDHPTNRSLGYSFALSGEGVVDVMSSKVFLTDVSTEIISNCKSISSVTFSQYKSDWINTYGLMKNEKIEPFKCISAGRGAERKLSWGKEICL